METITIIENTGIQLLSRKLTIRPKTDNKLLFFEYHNFFDISFGLDYAYQLERSKKIVRLADLLMCNYADLRGGITVPESLILANPGIRVIHDGNVQPWPDSLFQVNWGDHHCMVDKFFNQWIPVPFYEHGQRNDKFDLEPSTWCRCKIIPDEEQPVDGSLTATILFAFDSTSLFHNDCDSGGSIFGHKFPETSYRFCDTADGRLRFCSNDVIEYLMIVAHGVNCWQNMTAPHPGRHLSDFLASYLWLMEYFADNVDLPEVNLISDQWREKIPVEMVIDVGNSKTAAILFENHSMNESEPLVMQNFTDPVKSDGSLNRTQQPFDMRVAFQRADFGMKWGCFSKQFIWPSMVRLGDEALKLMYQASNQDQNGECLSTYSSPKRYLWDDKTMKEEWRCVIGVNGENEWPYIDGISDWFRANGEIGDGKIDLFNLGRGCHYSRKTLMTLAFMEIIAQATMQINSFDYRKNKGHIDAARYIDIVVLTCPIGMSKAERKSLHQCLEDAFYVLGKFYRSQDSTYTKHQIRIAPDLNSSVDKPQWMFDGATCAHFVYLYTEIALRYGNNCSVFFDRYGKLRNDLFVKDDTGNSIVYPDKTLTIGSVNIGAGITDVMICSYQYKKTVGQTTLTPMPKYWESFYTAGDDILKEFVQEFVIEGDNSMVAKKLEEQGLEANRINDLIIDFFGSDSACMTFKGRQIRREICQQISIPVAQRFLELTSEGVEKRDLDWDDIFDVNNRPNQLLLDNFAEHFGFRIEKQTWHYDMKVATKLINAVMKGLIKTISHFLANYKCDVVLLSGRPVSLPPIKDAFLMDYPVSPNRLIIMDKFRIGSGFPFVDQQGYSNDSKNAVLLGAMIGYLSSTSSLNGFSLDLSAFGKQMEPTTNYFMLLDDKMEPSDSCFITPTCNCGEIMVDSFPKYIGSKYIESPSYPTRPFYILDINEKEIIKRIKHERQLCGFDDMSEQEIILLYKQQRDKILKSCPLRFVIERPDFVEDKECLRIYSVEDSNFNLLPSNNFMLSPYSLKDTDCYWIDSGIFSM